MRSDFRDGISEMLNGIVDTVVLRLLMRVWMLVYSLVVILYRYLFFGGRDMDRKEDFGKKEIDEKKG